MRRLLFLVGVSLALWATPASAQAPADATAAEVLFQEGQALFADGKVAQACPKFAASYDLDPGLGTLLNLARCYEAAGRTASAWVAYVDLASLAARAGQVDRAAIANERVAVLEPKLMRLTVRVPQTADGLEVLLDDKALKPALYGSAIPVDPGEHVLVARVPGAEPWSRRVTVTVEGETVEVDVELPKPIAAPAPVPVSTPSPPPAPESVPPSSNLALLVAGGVVGGLGLVGIAIGGGFTRDAAVAWSDAGCSDQRHREHCPALALARAVGARVGDRGRGVALDRARRDGSGSDRARLRYSRLRSARLGYSRIHCFRLRCGRASGREHSTAGVVAGPIRGSGEPIGQTLATATAAGARPPAEAAGAADGGSLRESQVTLRGRRRSRGSRRMAAA